jgi:hypothetical protein
MCEILDGCRGWQSRIGRWVSDAGDGAVLDADGVEDAGANAVGEGAALLAVLSLLGRLRRI